MENWYLDLRFAMRRLFKRPTYALLAVLTLALGVGGTAAIFSLVRGYLFDSLPYAQEHQLVRFWFGGSWNEAEMMLLRPDFPGFTGVAAYREDDVTVGMGDGPLRLVPAIVSSAELFEVLGVRPLLGRGFGAGDDLPGAEPIALLSHGLWEELGGDPSLIGQSLRLDGVERTVAGVMPPGFWFPDPSVRVWLPAALDPANRSGRYTLVGRMEPGRSVEGMERPLTQITSRLGAAYDYPAQWDITLNPSLTPLREHVLGPVRPALLATLVAMAVILLIACANVAALMLGQVDSRSLELAVRSALGARRERLVSQMVAEAVTIGALAGIVGAVFATLGFRVLVGALPLGALAENAAIDWSLFSAAIAIAIAAALLIVLVPAYSIWRGDLREVLGGARTGGIRERGGRLEQGLVVAQVAMAVLMVAGAALLIRSVGNLRAIDPGFERRGVSVVDVAISANLEESERLRLLRAVLPELEALPGVSSVGAAQKIPLRGSGDNWGFSIEGEPEGEGTTTAFRIVTTDYFRTMGIPLIEGRGFDSRDLRDDAELAVVINEQMARIAFPGGDALGRRIETGFGWERIIGVVGTVSESSLTDAPEPARYMLYDQIAYTPETHAIVMRVEGDPASILESARATIQRVAPSMAVQSTTTMESVFDRAVGPARQIMSLLTLLGVLALVMGAIGVYGVVSHFVTRRRRDWGIRMALGLQPGRVITEVIGRGSALVASGILIGLLAFLSLARLLASFLHGVTTADPLALAGAAAVLLGAGAAAAFIPALRAGRIDPAVVLRNE